MSAVANVVCVGVETGAGRLGSDDGVIALFDMAGADTDLGTANGIAWSISTKYGTGPGSDLQEVIV